MSRRVVITGLGPVTSIGLGRDEFWEAIRASKSGVSLIEAWDTSQHSVRIGGEIKDFDAARWLDRRALKRFDPFVQFALIASDFALEDGGVQPESLDRARAGCVVGSGIGGLAEIGTQHKNLYERGPSRVSPLFIPRMMINAAPGEMAIRYKFKGPNFATASACASATHAMGMAFRLIRNNEADFILTGGSEAAIRPVAIAGFSSMKALSTRNDSPETASRPFDMNRDGFIMAEGAGILIFEELEHARARDAMIYAEVKGFGMTDDGHHITAPTPDGQGAADAMNMALDEAGVAAEDVQYINAHGTSTKFNDAMETRAIKTVFGDHASKTAISSTKSQLGHLLGASGGVELIATALAIRDSILPPTINLEEPDPDCDLDYVPNEPRSRDIENSLCNSFGFGGHNTCMLISKFHS
ncbi:MAG: beta-ketoacyl-ACP synthase II [Planctomycetota bacterium]|nr:beta-ketoacyl-ACP synthase II [Planctomycetota bacterium]